MKMKTLLLLIALLYSVQSASAQQVAASVAGEAKPSAVSAARIMPLAEVRAGQHGVGRTVFSGTEPEDFQVEILGVLDGFPGPRQSAILARLSGGQIGRTGVFAGMSGSPVFIEGRLIGAVAFTFPFVKEPIAGITPIELMLASFATRNATDASGIAPVKPVASGKLITFEELTASEWRSDLKSAMPAALVAASSPALASLAGQQLATIQTPLVFSGISTDALALFATQLQASGLMPVAGAGGAARITPLAKVTENTLQPGASVSVQLVRGDYSIAASGTVTLRDGEKIYAFGHPFLSAGSARMPMTESSVVTVVPSANNSFKLAAPGAMVGTIEQDRSTGIYGKLGVAPQMIPVKINLRTSRNQTQTYTFEVAHDEALTPLLLNLTTFSTITGSERSFGNATISMRGRIETSAGEAVQIERRFASFNAAVLAAGSIAAPAGLILNSGFTSAGIRGVTLDVEATDGKQIATLDHVALDRDRVRPGETINLNVSLRTPAGETLTERVSVEIPTDAAPGALTLFVGDGASLNRFSSFGGSYNPRTLLELVRLINDVPRNDRLYVRMFRTAAGAIVGARELPGLPPSVLATLSSDRATGGFTPIVLAGNEEREIKTPAPYIISGQQVVTVNVVR
jgi:hypothetical protein